MPLYVRAGGIVPTGPVMQHTGEAAAATNEPLDVTVYPGADGRFDYFDDDGISFDYRTGAWLGVSMTWREADNRLSVRLTPGSRLSSPRRLRVRRAGSTEATDVTFRGDPLDVTMTG
jgi:alpha-glucosidase (family GH31 glycosyl hydrolase)